ncbi:MAG: ABC transporter ATP-binding protein [Xanthobacteraceae bacterium]|nr:ABC transporter ATP-binding protein [Xanthobacteraceae bacterium]
MPRVETVDSELERKIDLRKLTKIYGGDRPVAAVSDINLQLAEGRFAAILGPSGCGKSTLLNLVAGFESASHGSVTVFGKPVVAPGPERAVVFQEANLFPWLNVFDNVTFSARLKGAPRQHYQPLAEELLAAVGLTGFERHMPDQLSGGMRQRVGIARALLMRPEVLLMDEPFGALDAQTRLQMQQLLLDVWEKYRKTVMFITHDIDEAIFLADVVYVMSARPGRITTELQVPLPRPRTMSVVTSGTFNQLRVEIFESIGQHRQ